MTKRIKVIYISLSGNTKYFVEHLSSYIETTKGLVVESLNVKDLKGETFSVDEPFVSILPTYLNGGNGIDNGEKEVLTTRLGDFIGSHNNAKYCYGIIGSGNRNFNKQFCLTAEQYTKRFQFPLIDVFELRGTQTDIKRIANLIIDSQEKFLEKSLKKE